MRHSAQRLLLWSCAALVLAGLGTSAAEHAPATEAAPAAAPAPPTLESDVRAMLQEKAFHKAEIGLQVMRLGAKPEADRALLKHNSDIPLIPASNLKLVTTSAALAYLGPEFKFRTLLLKHNDDLVLIGDGDPTLGDAEIFKKQGWDATTVFKNWAQQLRKSGVVKFNRLVVDDSVFDVELCHPNWPAGQFQKRYCAQVGGLNLNVNCVDFYLRNGPSAGAPIGYVMDPPTNYVKVRNTCVTSSEHVVVLARYEGNNQVVLSGKARGTGDSPLSVTVHDPALFAGTALAEALDGAGVKLDKPAAVRDRTLRAKLIATPPDKDPSWTVLAVHETALEHVVARANKDSVNLCAEALCKRVGAAVSGQAGGWRNGTAAIGEYLRKIGVDAAEFRLDDGSGLSKENAVSANAMCRVLAYNFHAPTKDTFLASLSVAGKDGTLEHRFQGALADLRGRVLAKSGFVNGVSTLSGYLKAKDGQWYAFSVLVNQNADAQAAKGLQERIVRAIDLRGATEAR